MAWNASSPKLPAPMTPAGSSPVRPSLGEMHPSKVHATMAPPSSTFKLGFTDVNAVDKTRDQPSGVTQTTPSKSANAPSSPFTFRFVRPQGDLGLSNQARKMMDELRGEAAKIKEDLAAQRAKEKAAEELNGRKIAMPKGRSGRFSAVHMAEFKKMDSIENHASAFRAVAGRTTPLTSSLSSLKRSPSKANLDEAETAFLKSSFKRSPSKPNLAEATASKSSLKRTPSKANLDDGTSSFLKKLSTATSSAKVCAMANTFDPPSPAKRVRQRLEDDASSSRPASQDGSFLPRPKSRGNDTTGLPRSQSNLAALMSPTKSSLARSSGAKEPVMGVFKSPPKPVESGMKKSATMGNLNAIEKKGTEQGRRILSPSRFEKVKSILRGGKGALEKSKTAIPLPLSGASQTPVPPRLEKVLPPVPVTSPRRKLVKRTVQFTPDTTRAIFLQHSPSPLRSGIPKSKTMRNLDDVQYPALDEIIANDEPDAVVYPDLSKHQGFQQASTKDQQPAKDVPLSVPGTFTFRSDHTIRFSGTSPNGFGGSAGQSSVRHVRGSFMPAVSMPGGFPQLSPSSQPNKENKAPTFSGFTGPDGGIAHGIFNKKRHRVSWDEEDVDREAEHRAAKKRRFESVPEGDALLAPRLMVAITPDIAKKPKPTIRAVGTVSPLKSPPKTSPAKKRPVLSLSRLNMLAKPKNRA
jgi:hypothetical protein